MAPKDSRRPTEAELAILRVLWDRGPSTVREITNTINQERKYGYTSVLKLLQIMTDKELVKRQKENDIYVYRSRYTRTQTQKRLVGHLVELAFGGSMSQLVMRALSTRKASPEELEEIRIFLDHLDET